MAMTGDRGALGSDPNPLLRENRFDAWIAEVSECTRRAQLNRLRTLLPQGLPEFQEDLKGRQGVSCLRLACSPGARSVPVVKALLEAGWPADGNTAWLSFPLAVALEGPVQNISVDVVRLLLVHGASVHAMAHYVFSEGGMHPPFEPPECGDPVWERALASGRLDIVQAFQDAGWSPTVLPEPRLLTFPEVASFRSPLACVFDLMGDEPNPKDLYGDPVLATQDSLGSIAMHLVRMGAPLMNELDGGVGPFIRWQKKSPEAAGRWARRFWEDCLPAGNLKHSAAAVRRPRL